MIRRLSIRGLVVIAEAEIEPAAGLTAITGETGAGKTVIAQALALLVGAQADARAVRPGASHALVEATFVLPEGFWDELDDGDPADAARELVDDPREVVVAVRAPAEGRSRALIDGQTSTRGVAASIAGRSMRFSSQHEGRTLIGGATQLAALDAFAGPKAQALASELAADRRALRRLAAAMDEARERREAAERERAALEDLVAAVDAAALDIDEEVALGVERDRLRYADRLAHAVGGAVEALDPEGGGGAVERVGEAMAAVEPAAVIDAELVATAEAMGGAQAVLQDAASTLRGYLAGLDAEPGRLDQVEERLAVYDRLARRYGPGVPAVVARAAEARATLADLDAGDGADSAIATEHADLLGRARERAGRLAQMRAEAAPRLEQALAGELADLAMGAAHVRLQLTTDDSDPPAERATIWLRPNPGLPEAPLAEAASGGELSRVLLALHGVAARAESHATWIFDEVDAGVGGVTATAVAAKLQALARERQVIVITHLPQVAAVADRHYRLVKGIDAQGTATTSIEAVTGDGLVDELCRMLGAAPDDPGARRHAEELLARRTSAAAPRRRRASAQS